MGIEQEGVLEAVFPGRRFAAVAGTQIPVGQVHVHHMATSVRLTISQVSTESSFGRASARAGLKVRPLISQVVLKTPPIEISQVRSGLRETCFGPVRQRPSCAARACGRGAARIDAELHQRADIGAGAERVPAPWRGPLRSSTLSPAAAAKSTTSSTVPPAPIIASLRRTGRGIKPLSVPIWISGAPLER